jgi:hypothetical protein
MRGSERMTPPRTRYAKSSQGHVAYQTIGDGPLDILFLTDHPTNLEVIAALHVYALKGIAGQWPLFLAQA